MKNCLTKALTNRESPVKDKHIQNAVMSTLQVEGGSTFWECFSQLPLRENCVSCWKFCFVLHTLLREGHANMVKESLSYSQIIQETGAFWGSNRHDYSLLVKLYCDLLSTKLKFHERNKEISGNLAMNNSDLMKYSSEDNEDSLFQLAVEMLDYLESILILQSETFRSLDKDKLKPEQSQCRLAPLVPCIKEAMLLYDYVTKIMFHLHSRLSTDLLLGHRQRFTKAFTVLQIFHREAKTRQFFKDSLSEIGELPKNSPNFLIISSIDEAYETQSVALYMPAENNQIQRHSSSAFLVNPTTSYNVRNTNTDEFRPSAPISVSAPPKDNRLEEIERVKAELRTFHAEAQTKLYQLRWENLALNGQLNEKNKLLFEKDKIIQELHMNNARVPDGAMRNGEIEATWEIKFGKMKELYTNLREEHICLLRQKGGLDKEVSELKRLYNNGNGQFSITGFNNSNEGTEANLKKELRIKDCKIAEMRTQMEVMKVERANLEHEVATEIHQLKEEVEKLSSFKSKLVSSKEALERQLQEVRNVSK